MPLSLSTAILVGNPDSLGWSQVHRFSPDDKEKKAKRGQLFAIFSASGIGEGIEAVGVGREIIRLFQEEYFGNLEQDAFERLKATCEKVGREFSLQEISLEVVAGVYIEGTIYFAVFGEGAVYILRGNRLGRIVQGNPSSSVCASGKPQNKDIFALVTSSFLSICDIKTITAALSSSKSEAAVELLAPIVHSKPQNSRVAVVVSSFEEEKDILKSEIPGSVRPSGVGYYDSGKVQTDFAGRLESRVKEVTVKLIDGLLKIFPQKKVYLRDDGLKKKRLVLTVGVLLLFVLSVSVIFGAIAKRDRQFKATYEGDLKAAQDGFKESLALRDISSERSREIARGVLSKVADLEARKIKDVRLDELKKNLPQLYKEVLGEQELEPSIFVDLTLLRADLTADKLSFSQANLAVLDRRGNRLVTFSISNKSPEVRGGPESLGNTKSVALYVDRSYVLSDRGILEVEKDGNSKEAVEKDLTWGEIVEIAAYAGNLYLLDKQGEIWRYPSFKEGFGARQRWLGKGVVPDFSSSLDLSIDGSIWVLKEGGKIEKYTLGSPDSFVFSGEQPPLASASQIFTNEDSQFVYVLDTQGKRVVAFDKRGLYKSQYKWEGLGSALDFAISESDGKIFILTGDKIYEAKIN